MQHLNYFHIANQQSEQWRPNELTSLVITYQDTKDQEVAFTLAQEGRGIICWAINRWKRLKGFDFLSFDDCYSEALIGFFHAIKFYDRRLCTQFSTYVKFKMASQLNRYVTFLLEQSGPIMADYKNLARIEHQFLGSNGRKPTLEELAEFSSLSPQRISSVRSYVAVSRLYRLDQPVGEEGEDSIVALTPDPQARSSLDLVIDAELQTIVLEAVRGNKHPDDQRTRRRVALYKDYFFSGLTLKQTGLPHRISYERVRQILHDKFTLERIQRALSGSCPPST